MDRLTRSAAAAVALCLVPTLLGPGTAAAQRPPEAVARVTLDRQATIDSFYDRWLRNNLVPVGWTGNAETCDPGTTSAAAEAATLDQINYYRELVGSPPAVVDQSLSYMPQRAALIMHANGQLNHFPPSTWRCYQEPFTHNLLTTQAAGWGIDSYIHDWGAQNLAVGHRRALLDPRVSAYAVGSTSDYNAVLIAARTAEGSTTSGWVAWPPAGMVASPLVSFRWSLDATRADLDLTNAVATVTGPAGQFTPTVVHRTLRGIVFEIPGEIQPPFGVDASYHITVSGITSEGVAAPDHSYVVTLVRPNRPVVAATAPTVSGTARVRSTLTATPATWATPGTYTDHGDWFRDGKKIASSFGTTYRLTNIDLGHQIHYAETGSSNYGLYQPTTIASAPVLVSETEVAPPNPPPAVAELQLVRRPKVRGTALVGMVLTAVPGKWRPAARSKFRWVRNGKVVEKGKKLRLTRAYAGKKLVLKVTGNRAGYRSAVVKVKVGRVRR